MENFKPRVLNKQLKILLFTNGLVLIAGAMMGPIYAIFVENVGGGVFEAGLGGAVFALAAGITSFLSGRLADRIKENGLIIVIGYLLMGISFYLYTFVNSILFFLILQAVIGFAEAFYSPAFNAIYSKFLNKKTAATAWGGWEMINYFSLAGGSFVGGIIVSSFGFYPLFIIMSLLALSSAFYIYFLPRNIL